MKQPDEALGRRSRRRPGSAEVSHAVFDRTRPYRHLRNPFTPMKVFSDDQVAAIHEAARDAGDEGAGAGCPGPLCEGGRFGG
jgi:trimethylamine:corrinoid methyltransferase-like protein